MSDLAASRAFYETVLPPLGLAASYLGPGFIEWGDFSIAEAGLGGRVTRDLHIAFAAASREHVDAFHRSGIAGGYRDNGWGDRPEYHVGYYAAYLFDPDGNNVEAVFHDR